MYGYSQAAGLFIEIISTRKELAGLDAWNAKWVNTSLRQKWVGADSEYSVPANFRHTPPVHILERWKKTTEKLHHRNNSYLEFLLHSKLNLKKKKKT